MRSMNCPTSIFSGIKTPFKAMMETVDLPSRDVEMTGDEKDSQESGSAQGIEKEVIL